VIDRAALAATPGLQEWQWHPLGANETWAHWAEDLEGLLTEGHIPWRADTVTVDTAGPEKRAQFEAVRRWFDDDWMRLEPKLRTSIVEGISVFLSLFDDNPGVKYTFCPPKETYQVDVGAGSGGTSTGKTTLLNAIVATLPAGDRIVIIEDTAELHLPHANQVRLEARRAQRDLPAVTIRDLLRASLRHRPDRIIVGEVRGGEAYDLLEALNTGHAGTLSTIHANSAEQAHHSEHLGDATDARLVWRLRGVRRRKETRLF